MSASRAESTVGATLLALVLVVAVACVPELPRSRTWVSDELASRTGMGLRKQPDRELAMPPGVRNDGSLTVDEAVAVALWNNAAFQSDLAQLGVARADLADAGVLPNPILSLLFPVGAKQLEITVKQSLGAIWQRPRRVAAARKDAARVAELMVQRGLDLARDVRVAYGDVVLAEQRVVLSAEADVIWAGLLAIADARLQAGDASRREVVSASADARVAHAATEHAATEVEVARGTLRGLLGAPTGFALKLDPGASADASPSRPWMSARTATSDDAAPWIATALAARPDLRAASLAVEAASERAGLERRRIIELVGILDINGSGPEIGPGLEVPLPLFDQRQAGRIRARAELERASWAYVGLRRQIAREVHAAHARLVLAEAALGTWQTDILPARAEATRLATRAFERGEESHLVVLEATRTYVETKQRSAELAAERSRAAAELERVAGGRARAK